MGDSSIDLADWLKDPKVALIEFSDALTKLGVTVLAEVEVSVFCVCNDTFINRIFHIFVMLKNLILLKSE